MSPPRDRLERAARRRRRSRHGGRGRGRARRGRRRRTGDRSGPPRRARGRACPRPDHARRRLRARELERRLRDAGLAAAARGRLCWLHLERESLARAAGPRTRARAEPPGRGRPRAVRASSRPAIELDGRGPEPRPCCGPSCRPSAPSRRWRRPSCGPRDCGCESRPALRGGSRRGARSPASTRAARLAPRGRLARGLVGASAQRRLRARPGASPGAWPPSPARRCRSRSAACWRCSSAPCCSRALGGAVTGKSRAQRAADLVGALGRPLDARRLRPPLRRRPGCPTGRRTRGT